VYCFYWITNRSNAVYIDFSELKQRVDVTTVADMLGLKLAFHQDSGQWRGPCPHCKDGGERALVVTPSKGYYCFADKKGGDCIALAAHILNVSMRDAARRIVELEQGGEEANVSADLRPPADESGTQPLEPLAYLLHTHEAVQALGLDPSTAERLGIGYAKKGIMRGRVAIPIRTADGTLAGYCGYAAGADPPLKLPKSYRMT
jgi:DNA primase